MHRFFKILLVALILSSCTTTDDKNYNKNIASKWKLIEQLSDPGDGSGVFESVQSSRTIEFYNDGTVRSNGELCFMSYEAGNVHLGTYSDTEDNIDFDGEIIPEGCEFEGIKIYYQFEDSNLILWYLCIEGCGQKFSSVE